MQIHFISRLEKRLLETHRAWILRHLVTAVAEGTVEDLTRFEVPAKALRFFRRHAGLFSNNVGPLPRALQLYGYVRLLLVLIILNTVYWEPL